VVSPSKILQHNALLAQILAEIATFRLTIPIATAGNGGSVQQRLSAAAPPGLLPYWVGAADKLYSLGVKEDTASGAHMTKQESEKAIRYLCTEWAKLRGIQIPPIEQPSFSDFYSWVRENYGHYLTFRSTLSVSDHVEAWFDDEFKQNWRN
jgi:hypothetical protein